MKTVEREQFKILSDLEVVHVPTGARFSVYPYSNTDDRLRSVTENCRITEDKSKAAEDYAKEDIKRMAMQILLEVARGDDLKP